MNDCRVSIPFKQVRSDWFQFPSNGKGFPNVMMMKKRAIEITLFQFPSNGKGFPNMFDPYDALTNMTFQFPSNGIGFPNVIK